jgi:hypothetical protein
MHKNLKLKGKYRTLGIKPYKIQSINPYPANVENMVSS